MQEPVRHLGGFKLDRPRTLSTSDQDQTEARRARGMEEISEASEERPTNGMIWMEVGSTALKSGAQLTIWEAVSFWLACLMVVNTVVYNGFATGDRTSDGYLRLFLVATYAFLQLLFSTYTTHLHRETYGYVIAQASWVVLTNLLVFTHRQDLDWWLSQNSTFGNNEEITFSNYEERPAFYDDNGLEVQYEDRGLILRHFHMVLLGEWTVVETLGSVFTNCNCLINTRTGQVERNKNYEGLENRSSEIAKHKDKQGKAYFKKVEWVVGDREKRIKATRELEVKALAKALETGLEKVLAHIVVMLGILLSTGVAPYTSVEFGKSNAMQLGSYALLLAVSAGVTALFSSVTSIKAAEESLKLLLRLQEHLITMPAAENPNQHFNPYSIIPLGFSDRQVFRDKASFEISLVDVLRDTHGLRRWGCLIFGRGLALLPNETQLRRGVETHWSNPFVANHDKTTVQFSTTGGLRVRKIGETSLTRAAPADMPSHSGYGAIIAAGHPEEPNGCAMSGVGAANRTGDTKPRKASSMREEEETPALNLKTMRAWRSTEAIHI
ncbi:hypothetical protein PG989_004325 [Apiospora arundinis]